jgi:hypothetical protein
VFDESMMTGFAFLVEFSPLQKRFIFTINKFFMLIDSITTIIINRTVYPTSIKTVNQLLREFSINYRRDRFDQPIFRLRTPRGGGVNASILKIDGIILLK